MLSPHFCSGCRTLLRSASQLRPHGPRRGHSERSRTFGALPQKHEAQPSGIPCGNLHTHLSPLFFRPTIFRKYPVQAKTRPKTFHFRACFLSMHRKLRNYARLICRKCRYVAFFENKWQQIKRKNDHDERNYTHQPMRRGLV